MRKNGGNPAIPLPSGSSVLILEGKLHFISVSSRSNVMDYMSVGNFSIALTPCISVIFGDLDKHFNPVGDYMHVHRIFYFSQN